MFYNKTRIEMLRARYSIGTRIELLSMKDESDMPNGLRGTVDFVDDIGQLQMSWDNGRTLALNPDVDRFRKIIQEETETQNSSPSLDM
jgi:hypothetical protein